MSVHKVPIVQITGLSISGTTDGSGAWNPPVDLDTFTTVPSGATGVILGITNTGSSDRWMGARTPGKTNTIVLVDLSGNNPYTQCIVPLGAGNTIDLYLEGTSVQFRILGFTDSSWTFFDIDGTLPSITNTGGARGTVTAPADVAGATAILALNFAGQWSPTGQSSQISTNAPSAANQLLMNIDGSRQLDLAGTNPVQILGFTDSTGVTWTTWLSSAETITADGTWRDGSSSNAGQSFAHLQRTGFSSTQGFSVREDGVSTPSGSPLNSQGVGQFAPLSAGGAYEYNAESTFTGVPYVVAWLSEPVVAGETNITDVSETTPYHGQTGVVVTCTNANASQGDGEIYVCSANDPDHVSAVNQTVTSWSDTGVTITMVLDSFDFDTDLYLFIRNSDEEEDTTGFVIRRAGRWYLRDDLIDLSSVSADDLSNINYIITSDAAMQEQIGSGTGEVTNATGDFEISYSQGDQDPNSPDPVWLVMNIDGAVGSELGGIWKLNPVVE